MLLQIGQIVGFFINPFAAASCSSSQLQAGEFHVVWHHRKFSSYNSFADCQFCLKSATTEDTHFALFVVTIPNKILIICIFIFRLRINAELQNGSVEDECRI